MKKRIEIHIGGLFAGRKPVIIETLLGSCAAVCLYDPVERIGGMNHILLPGDADTRHFDSSARYGINAMELLINRIMRLGGDRHRLVAKAFGGAHILPTISLENGMGRKNIAFVREFLETEGIRLVSFDLGGRHARRISFHIDTGEVFVRRICRLQYESLGIKERELWETVRKEAESSGGISLFIE